MAKQPKIEKYGCQDIVANGLRRGRSLREIAVECSDWAGVSISHTAVKSYIDTLNEQKKEVVVKDERALVNVVHQDFDIIQTTLKMAGRVMERFDYIDNLPEYIEERMQELEHQLRDAGDNPEYLEEWHSEVSKEMKRKVYEIATLSKETREYLKLMADLRERVYQFDLMGEYLSLFMAIYQRHSPDAYEKAMQEVAANPRMAHIVEQQRMYTDRKGGY